MILSNTILLLAALVAPTQPVPVAVQPKIEMIAITIQFEPEGSPTSSASFEPQELRRAVIDDLESVGIAAGYSRNLPTLAISVRRMEAGKFLALSPRVNIITSFKLIRPGVDEPAPLTAECATKTKFNLALTPGERAKLAMKKCLRDLSQKIVAHIAEEENLAFTK